MSGYVILKNSTRNSRRFQGRGNIPDTSGGELATIETMEEEYCAGINKIKRPTTKVVAPPGGQSNINIFGGDEPTPHTVNAGQAKRNKSSIFDSPDEPPVTAKNDNKNTSNQATPSTINTTDGSPPPVENATAPGGGRASTKVMAPPGGKTSINLFG